MRIAELHPQPDWVREYGTQCNSVEDCILQRENKRCVLAAFEKQKTRGPYATRSET